MNKVIITGGTGFIGLSLANHLVGKGLTPILVARNAPKSSLPHRFVKWDGRSLGPWVNELEGARAIVNLAGKSVDCIKTPDTILRSRVDSTHIIGKALKTLKSPPPVWVQMSTAHIYGDPPSQLCTESSATGYGLAPFVGRAWEEALLESLPNNTREVRLRTSFVLGKNGGGLVSLKKIAKLGLGGKVGHGKQGISWIHENDLNELTYQTITNEDYKGVYIASAPNPVSNQVFMKELRRCLGINLGLSTPLFMTRFGAKLFFKTDPELAIYGRYVKSERLEKQGFVFEYPELKTALADALAK